MLKQQCLLWDLISGGFAGRQRRKNWAEFGDIEAAKTQRPILLSSPPKPPKQNHEQRCTTTGTFVF